MMLLSQIFSTVAQCKDPLKNIVSYKGSFELVRVVDHLDLRFLLFVSIQLSVSNILSALFSLPCSSVSPLFYSNPSFSLLSSNFVFHSVSCHCLSVLSQSQLASECFFLSVPTGTFLLFHPILLSYWYFPLTFTPPCPPPHHSLSPSY